MGKDPWKKIKISNDGKFYKGAIEDLQELFMMIEIDVNDISETLLLMKQKGITGEVVKKLEDAKNQLCTQLWHVNNSARIMGSMRRIIFPHEEVMEDLGFSKSFAKKAKKKIRKKTKNKR